MKVADDDDNDNKHEGSGRNLPSKFFTIKSLEQVLFLCLNYEIFE